MGRVTISHKALRYGMNQTIKILYFLSVIVGRRRRMAGKNDLQKTVAFRLNLSKADEKELFQEILKHGRNVENDIYGSSGAYVKAALRHYHRQESELELQEQYRQEMRCYLQELAEEQRKVFLDGLLEHDKELAVTVAEAVMRAVGGIKISDAGMNEGRQMEKFRKQSAVNPTVGISQTEQSESIGEKETDDALPDEALLYLSNL